MSNQTRPEPAFDRAAYWRSVESIHLYPGPKSAPPYLKAALWTLATIVGACLVKRFA